MTRSFKPRPFVALVVTFAFLITTITGIVLYIVPQGRIANWVDWSLLGLGKDQWADVHILLGLVFILAGIVHLYFNWKPFRHHLAARVKGHFSLRVELVAAVVLATTLVAGAVAHVPPLNSIFALNDRAKTMWLAAPEYEPPYGHAESSTLDVLARRTFIDPVAARAQLTAAGFDLLGPRATVAEIARHNGTSPMGLYMQIASLARPPSLPDAMTPEAIELHYSGTGIGRRTVAEMAVEASLTPEQAIARLEQAGVPANPGETLRKAGEASGHTPIQLMQIMLLGPQAQEP